MSGTGVELDEEDAKLVTLARGARGRIGAEHGAAIRDDLGRTYAGADVSTEHLTIGALELAVASALAAGAKGAEAAVIVRGRDLEGADEAEPVGIDALRDLGGPGVPVYLCHSDGAVARVHQT